MKKFYLAGMFAVAAIAMAPVAAYAEGDVTPTWNAANVILPSSEYTPNLPYQALVYVVNTGQRYEGAQGYENENYNHVWGVPANDAAGNAWYAVNYSPVNGESSEWTLETAPFSSDEYYKDNKSFQWITSDIMGDFYMRRTFTLNTVHDGPIYLACGHDDAPAEYYLNGVLVHMVADGWNNGEYVLLEESQKALLKPGENVLAVHVHQNWGGAFADCGLYAADYKTSYLNTVADGAWDCVYKLIDTNEDIAAAVEAGAFAKDADESDWTVGQGSFSNSDDQFRVTYWNSNTDLGEENMGTALLVRRHFTLTASEIAAMSNAFLTCSYDEYPKVYLNGELIWSADGWNDARYDTYELTPEQVALLVEGDNVLAVSVQRGGGGGHIDYGFYSVSYCDNVEMSGGTEPLKEQLQALIDQAKSLPTTPHFATQIADAEAILAGTPTSTALLEAIDKLQSAIAVIRAARNDIQAYYDTQSIFTDAEATAKFEAAQTRDDYANAIKTLRFARRRSVAETQEDVFVGAEPAEGAYYLYNVGQKQFLQGGSDWGAHAALGIIGNEINLIDEIAETNAGTKAYVIETGLYNGAEQHFLGYRGYMDSGYDAGAGGWAFLPVEGRTNTYYIVQADYPDVHVQWNPFGSVDGGNNDETNVCTESRNLDPTNEDAMWKLVTRAERDALIATASLENPVDLSYYIVNPNFNQRETIDNWSVTNFAFWGRGGNYPDFTAESWNQESSELVTMVEGLPEGIYEVSVTGFYRNGSHKYHDNIDGYECLGQANLPEKQNAWLFAGNDYEDDVQLPNILSESGKAPGEGADYSNADGTKNWHIPEYCNQATNYFKLGLYKAYTVVEQGDGVDMSVGVYKEEAGDEPGDWIVVDNFRLKYYGKDTTKQAVKDYLAGVEDVMFDSVARPADNRIFNLQGMEVKNANTPGIYISNGKKFIVR
ncbi:MAG: hypothetical protein J1F20_01200 [Muribaculaceae bacterium]|nr:hypothetical protein [Muribaculaceae bacterium]